MMHVERGPSILLHRASRLLPNAAADRNFGLGFAAAATRDPRSVGRFFRPRFVRKSCSGNNNTYQEEVGQMGEQEG